ncbi:MAG TPA: hypothetical protein VFN44_19325 [Solirubrobacteraceae bacterium]|nr:hypothetical protein [Solirubrobacteraceae bacterium]
MRIAPLVVLLCLLLAATASAHDPGADHSDTRVELAGTDIAGTVATVETAAGTEDQGLPATWCGDPLTSDDTANAAFSPATHQLKLVYAYASDMTSRFSGWSDALQADVSLIGRFMGAQSGGRRTLQFDMGTRCGPEYVDIQIVQLPGTRASYASLTSDARISRLRSELGGLLTSAPGPRNVLVLGDQLSNSAAFSWSGIGESWSTEMKGPASPHNDGELFSALWVPNALGVPGADPDGWWPEGMLHELTHNLGSVGPNAPHATDYGHCYDGYDVMCYDDDFDPSTYPLTAGCPSIPGVMNQVYDCGNDDYFNVAPPAGSYLANNWNAYDSPYLVACEDARPACGGTTVPDTNPKPPVSTSQPTVLGDARVGAALSATTGDWTNAPTSFAYQWERGDGLMWIEVGGATGPTYGVASADAGRRLRVRVIATNADGSTAAYSGATGVIASPTGTISTTPPPSLTVPNRGRATLKVARGRGKGKRIGTIDFQITAGRLKAFPTRVKLARGRYEVRLCTTAVARCATRKLKVARRSIARLPGLTLGVPSGSTGRVTYTLRATRGVFSALTAKRPSAGLLLGP